MFHDFMMWLGAKNPAEKYDGMDLYKCALAQFGRSKFPDAHEVRGITFTFEVIPYAGNEKIVYDVADYDRQPDFGKAVVHEETFGRLYKRLEKSVV